MAGERGLAKAGLPLFDPEALPAALGLDEQAVLADLYAEFLRQLQGALAAFTTLPELADARALRELAHNLKSSSSMVGASLLGLIFGEIETAIDQGDQGTFTRLVEDLLAIAPETIRQIEGVAGGDPDRLA